VRDLVKDLGYLDKHILNGRVTNVTLNDFVSLSVVSWPEAIMRAIAAEGQIAAYRESNDLQRHSIQQLSAQVTAYREGLEQIKAITQSWQGMALDWDAIHAISAKLLSSPDPDTKEG